MAASEVTFWRPEHVSFVDLPEINSGCSAEREIYIGYIQFRI